MTTLESDAEQIKQVEHKLSNLGMLLRPMLVRQQQLSRELRSLKGKHWIRTHGVTRDKIEFPRPEFQHLKRFIEWIGDKPYREMKPFAVWNNVIYPTGELPQLLCNREFAEDSFHPCINDLEAIEKEQERTTA